MDELELEVEFSLDHEAVRKRSFMVDENLNKLTPTSTQRILMQKGVSKNVSVVVFVKMLGVPNSGMVPFLCLLFYKNNFI